MAIDGGETFLDFMNRLGDPARHAGYDDDTQERTSQPEVKMSDRTERMKTVFAKKAGSATDAELQLLDVVAAELDDLESRIGSLKARSGRQPKTVEEMTEYLREDLKEAREIFRACDEGSIPRLPARKFGPRAQPEDLPEESK